MRRLAPIAVAAILVAGCGSSHVSSSRHKPQPHYPLVVHLPRVTRASQIQARRFVQLVSPTRLVIVTWGSGSCPNVPNELIVQSPHKIRLRMTIGTWDDHRGLVAHLPPNGICTTDIRTTPMALTIDPRLVDVHRPLTVSFFSKKSKKPFVRVAPPLS